MNGSVTIPSSAWVRLLVTWIVLAGAGLYAATYLQVATSIAQLATSPDEAQTGNLMARMAHSAGARTMVFVVEGTGLPVAFEAAAALVDALADHEEVARISADVDVSIGTAFWELGYPHRFGLAAEDPSALPSRLSPAGLDAMAQDLRGALAGVRSPIVKRIAPGDPWLFFERRIEALSRMRMGGVAVHDGHWVSADGRAAVVWLQTQHSPFDATYQKPLEDVIKPAVAQIASNFGVTIERSSIHRLAVQSQRAIEADIRRISMISTVAIVALLWGLFRSVRIVLLAALPLAGGLAMGAAACAFVFESVHAISVGFGAVLVGVAIDYPLHLCARQRLHGGAPWMVMRQIRPALCLGTITTATAFAALAGSGMPGVREIGVFAGVGVLTALVITLGVLPAWLPHKGSEPRLQRVAVWAQARYVWVLGHRRLCRWVVLAIVGLCAATLPHLTWLDDATALAQLEPTALDEDDRVRQRVGRTDFHRTVVALGASGEAALVANDAVAGRLGAVATLQQQVITLHDLVWSAELQARNHAEFRAVPQLAERTGEALQRAGFRPEMFAPFGRDLERPFAPLTLAVVLASPLSQLAEPFWLPPLTDDDPVAIVTYLRGFELDALQREWASNDEIVVLDRHAFSTRVYRRYRQRMLWTVAVGVALMCGVLMVRYRCVADTLAALAPALLAVVATVAVLVGTGQALHLMHVVALLLVLGMGVDYGVFLVERVRAREALGGLVVSLLAAWATTLGAFALLAASDHPALHALGMTVAIGVTWSLVLAPVLLAVVRGRPR